MNSHRVDLAMFEALSDDLRRIRLSAIRVANLRRVM